MAIRDRWDQPEVLLRRTTAVLLVVLTTSVPAAAHESHGRVVTSRTMRAPTLMLQATLIGASAREHTWIRRSLMPSPPTDLAVMHTGCPLERLPPERADPAAEIPCTFPGGALYLPASLENRGMFFHELGHQFDYRMSDHARFEFLLVTGDRRPWRFNGPNSPHERFAEAYSDCARYPTMWLSMSGDFAYGWSPSPRRHRLVCALMRREAIRQGWIMLPADRR